MEEPQDKVGRRVDGCVCGGICQRKRFVLLLNAARGRYYIAWHGWSRDQTISWRLKGKCENRYTIFSVSFIKTLYKS